MKIKNFISGTVILSLFIVAFVGAVYSAPPKKQVQIASPSSVSSFSPRVIGRVTVENGTTTILDSRIRQESVVLFNVFYGDDLQRENNVVVWEIRNGKIVFGIVTPDYNINYDDVALIHFAIFDPEGSLYYNP